MSAIPLRLGVIEAMDPNWQTDRLFDKELYNSDLKDPDPTKRIPGYAQGLDTMFSKMTDAVQCGWKPNIDISCNFSTFPPQCVVFPSIYVACADTDTGLSLDQTLSWGTLPEQLSSKVE